jgi:hypothetical protein
MKNYADYFMTSDNTVIVFETVKYFNSEILLRKNSSEEKVREISVFGKRKSSTFRVISIRATHE